MSRAFRLAASLLICLLAASCAGHHRQVLPELSPVAADDLVARRCQAAFPTGDWQFVHTINFKTAAGNQGSVIGVVRLAGGGMSCALLTVEGLTLFAAEAEDGGKVSVSRAVPPFDKPSFAEGLITDLRTIFRRPAGRPEFGKLSGGDPVCRSTAADLVTDLQPGADGCVAIATYKDGLIDRQVQPSACRLDQGTIIATNLELRASGSTGYTLNLHLLSAEQLGREKITP